MSVSVQQFGGHVEIAVGGTRTIIDPELALSIAADIVNAARNALFQARVVGPVRWWELPPPQAPQTFIIRWNGSRWERLDQQSGDWTADDEANPSSWGSLSVRQSYASDNWSFGSETNSSGT